MLGEASKLTDAERRQVTAGVMEAAGELPVCVGVTHPGTDGAVAFAREAEAMGAYAVMLAPPALAKPNDAAVIAHYRAVADAIGLPIVVQDHPASSGVHMSVDVLVDIARRRRRPVASSSSRRSPARPRSAGCSRPTRTCGSSAASARSCCSRSSAAAPPGR